MLEKWFSKAIRIENSQKDCGHGFTIAVLGWAFETNK